ncbi:MAG: GDSL-type esterase/lipase family protein [Thermodesulfobacteriota bacterium]
MTAPQLIFLGDSLIEFCDWQDHFPGHAVVNLGLAGETVQELRQRVEHLAGRLENPAWFLLMIGTNNVAVEDYGFFADYRALVAILRQRHPAAALQVTSLLPMHLPWLAPETIPRLNSRLRELAQDLGAGYVDAYAAFVARGNTGPFFLDDGVHLSDAGYTVWAAAIRPFLPHRSR